MVTAGYWFDSFTVYMKSYKGTKRIVTKELSQFVFMVWDIESEPYWETLSGTSPSSCCCDAVLVFYTH